MEAARRCEIVADTTQALNADWQDPQPMGAHPASLSQAMRRGPVAGQRQFQDILCEPESLKYVM